MNDVGRVLGTEDAQPLEFWVGVAEDRYLQLDDVVEVATEVPGQPEPVRLFGVVDMVRSRYEGAKFDSDVFRVSDGVLPAGIATAAHVSVTRVEPEVYVPPQPGQPVARATGTGREMALFFDRMGRPFPIGISRDGQPLFGNLEFLDGTRGAHVNISGISGVATKTTYAMFLLYSLFHSQALGLDRANTRAIVFNVKGEDLLFLDKPNARLEDGERAVYASLGLEAGPFASVGLWAPVRAGVDEPVPATGSRQMGVESYFWTLREFCEQRLLRFMFAEADNEASQLSFVAMQVERGLEEAAKASAPAPWIAFGDRRVQSFEDLRQFIEENVDSLARLGAEATKAAFVRRFAAAATAMGHLVRGVDAREAADHRINWQNNQVNVIDIHNLRDHGKRFVVGAVLRRLMEEKEAQGTSRPLVFVVLDELNKYAPREGWSPIKEVVLDMAERGRSMGVVLVGAQQTASEIERRVVANSSFRVVGRLDTAEAQRGEYGFLPLVARQRSAILKPGSMFVQQPEIPIPLLTRFPFPCWATRKEEVAEPAAVESGGRREPPMGFER